MVNKHQQVAILDFGSQYTHLIARRFRQIRVLAKIYPADYDVSQIDNLVGVVLSGGPGIAGDEQYEYQDNVFELGVPVLGLCFGHQLMAKYFGGEVEVSSNREYGQASLNIGSCKLFAGLESPETVWMSHGDCVSKIPDGFKVLGTTSDKSIAAMGSDNKQMYGLQFHPEVTHTPHGLKMLENFALDICGAQGDWNSSNLLAEVIEQIKKQVRDKKVFMLVSGGVDSSVAFALLIEALGKNRVYGMYVDTGLMRKNETQEIKQSLNQTGFDNLHIKDAGDEFLNKLAGVIDPEEKRKVIGQAFLDIKDNVASELNLNPDEWLLGQGTIYPDTIETGGTKHADTIKTHHNRVDAIQKLIQQGKVVEPIKDFYKDEVREIGRSLRLPKELINRHPFPGPGLGIRVLCSDGESNITEEELKRINRDVKEIIAMSSTEIDDSYVLPLKSVGVQGDNRTYAHPAVLRLSEVGLLRRSPTSEVFNWQQLGELSSKITNSLKTVNRVLLEIYSLGSFEQKEHATKLISGTVTKDRLGILRECDAIVMNEVKMAGLYDKIWQFPVILLPYGIDGRESLVLRPVESLEAMTAKFYPLPAKVIEKIVKRIRNLDTISYIYIDITNKPPGTIEWE